VPRYWFGDFAETPRLAVAFAVGIDEVFDQRQGLAVPLAPELDSELALHAIDCAEAADRGCLAGKIAFQGKFRSLGSGCPAQERQYHQARKAGFAAVHHLAPVGRRDCKLYGATTCLDQPTWLACRTWEEIDREQRTSGNSRGTAQGHEQSSSKNYTH
jgi:hypothetical protein